MQLIGPGGLLAGITAAVCGTALQTVRTERLGYERSALPEAGTQN